MVVEIIDGVRVNVRDVKRFAGARHKAVLAPAAGPAEPEPVDPVAEVEPVEDVAPAAGPAEPGARRRSPRKK